MWASISASLQNSNAGASDIISWALTIGDQTLDQRRKDQLIRWAYGDSLRLVIRWAKDGSREPVSSPDVEGRVETAEKTITYIYTNAWSLFSLMQQHAAPPTDAPGGQPLEPNTLKFTIPLEGTPERTVIYVRLVLKPPGGTASLTFPGFP